MSVGDSIKCKYQSVSTILNYLCAKSGHNSNDCVIQSTRAFS